MDIKHVLLFLFISLTNTHSVCDPPWEMKRFSLSSETHWGPLKFYLHESDQKWAVQRNCNFWGSTITFVHCEECAWSTHSSDAERRTPSSVGTSHTSHCWKTSPQSFKKKNECGKYMQYAEFHISVPVNHSETTLTGTRNFSSLFSLDQSSTQRRISKYLLYFQLVVQTAGVLSSAEMLHEQIPPTEPLLTIRNSSHSFPYLNPLI